ncbi:DUF4254 domain-containing protein [Nocardia cyriacigeorgica]|uniref:DUF4254 domain-containing protein n=1 Tax=Nocardia cyriacigeorgica TaxID=135487 RepID=UPI001893E4BA|nr:DUF4254 domain-containing protein [Nocardia cyriacigeorgica]MBF6438279.1 DUF4254 domain-containing protein [Nocardia cyriacigeorgica]MBF6453814.1 DUF4254 domain-containing protein [Nocardia cyriacigeorgica]MBF6481443.1 DUF4254 domain-containing protein [Nocardia cyriacigeorgica]MBF6550982.1 DUF4254 domain-containing protein [Nocardia cyriacigeorgica]
MPNHPLPEKHRLLHACRTEMYTDHPMLRLAYQLTTLHERRLCSARESIDDRKAIDDLDAERLRHIRAIDTWVNSQIPPTPGSAHLHTETLGTIVDRLARYTAQAYAALADGSGELGDAWERLAELAVGYDDLASEVAAGRRRLPGPL